MSLFPRSFITHDPTTSFHPLFRLLDDFDRYNRGNDNNSLFSSRTDLKTFTPKFDVKELSDSYELHGELPGIEQKDVEIDFTDSQTLTIHGHTERTFTSGEAPAGFIEGAASIEENKNQESTKPDTNNKDVAKQSTTDVTTKDDNKSGQSKTKYWVSERSVGEFSRSFNFPARVDQENVRASMKNGILSVIVPKSNKPESRKITISS